MEDRPSIPVRGAIAIAVAVAVNAVVFYAFDAMGVELRVPAAFGSTELADMTLPPVLILTAVPSLIAVILAIVLDRSTGKARTIFSNVVVLGAVLSLLTLMSLDSPTTDRIFQGVMHLVPAAALVALVGPSLRSESASRRDSGRNDSGRNDSGTVPR